MENCLSCIFAIICASVAVVLCGKSSVELQLTFRRIGMKAISGKQVSSLQRSLLQCILQGLSNLQCHAVNYNPISSVCELIMELSWNLTMQQIIHLSYLTIGK